MKKKTTGILIGVAAAVAVLSGSGYYFRNTIRESIPVFRSGKVEDKVYVEKISKIMNQYTGVSNRYNGVVESQDTYEVNVDSSRNIEEIYVKIGEEVTEGQKLVRYDVSEVEMQVQQGNLELERINNEIENYRKQIAALNEAIAKSQDEDERFEHTTEIQSLENSIEQSKFDLESKNLEIAKYHKELANAVVASKQAGIVKEINEDGTDSNGNSAPFMRILKAGEYRVKGSIDEQNIWTIREEQNVLIRSRVDEKKVWKGKISKLDKENIQQNNNENYGGGEGIESATKYPFYIELDSAEDLLLGQHVYIEMDDGQNEKKEGLWLFSNYVVQDESGTYVWAADEKNRLVKRMVELGEMDEKLLEYQILSGITKDDYITWAMPGLYEGVKAVTSMDEVNYESPLYNQESTEFLEDMDRGTETLEMLYGTEVLYDMDGTEQSSAKEGTFSAINDKNALEEIK